MVTLRPYRVPQALETQIQDQINDMIQAGIIEQFNSKWSSPLLAIKKPNGDLRLAIDFRELNKRALYDAFPTPRVDELISHLRGASIFSKLYFKSGYYQIPMNDDDKHKTAFRFKNNLYHFNVMPFGLATATQTFVKLMNKLFNKVPFVEVYIDDVIIFSENELEHLIHFETVFQIIKDANLTINLNKCEFFKSKIEFLGYTISKNMITP